MEPPSPPSAPLSLTCETTNQLPGDFLFQNGIFYFFLGLVWGFFGSAFGLGSDFGFGSSTGLGFGSGFGFSAGGLEKVKFFFKKKKRKKELFRETRLTFFSLDWEVPLLWSFSLVWIKFCVKSRRIMEPIWSSTCYLIIGAILLSSFFFSSFW